MEAMSGSPVRQLVISSRIQDRQFVRVSVEDSGPGVPKAIAENLFRAFVSTKAQGMGLGLSICRTIIEANGGRIWLEPRSGGGSIFHFTLARVEGEGVDGRYGDRASGGRCGMAAPIDEICDQGFGR